MKNAGSFLLQKKSKKVLTKWDLSAKINPAVGNAGVAQLVEQLICKVGGSNPSTSSKISYGGIPERSTGADCKSVASASVVRIHLPPPSWDKHCLSQLFFVFRQICEIDRN